MIKVGRQYYILFYTLCFSFVVRPMFSLLHVEVIIDSNALGQAESDNVVGSVDKLKESAHLRINVIQMSSINYVKLWRPLGKEGHQSESRANPLVILAIGKTQMVSYVALIGTAIGVPTLGYTVDEKSTAIKRLNQRYIQLNPSADTISRSIVKLFEVSSWFSVTLIVEDVFEGDGFLDDFRYRTSQDSHWKIDYVLTINDNNMSDTVFQMKLLELQSNRSQIHVVYCSGRLAARIIQLATTLNRVGAGSAWIIVPPSGREKAYLENTRNLPIGLLSIIQDVQDNLSLMIEEIGVVLQNVSLDIDDVLGCFGSSARNANVTINDLCNSIIYRKIVKNKYLKLIPLTPEGSRMSANASIYNLVNTEGHSSSPRVSKWQEIGMIGNGSVQFKAIVWPGDAISGPLGIQQKHLRVVTTLSVPFVDASEALITTETSPSTVCLTNVPCLKVHTKDAIDLAHIFKRFQSGRLKDPDFKVMCCSGLTIDLLQQLAKDLKFTYEVYLVADGKFGGKLPNGSWNGMVHDLKEGVAHMAVAPLSMTHARSKVIDFTEAYYHSGFVMLVAERPNGPGLDAFLAPFLPELWISIIAAGFVTGITLAVLEWKSPFGLNPWGRKRKSNYTLGSGMNSVFAILFSHTTKTKSPKSWPAKWVQNFWAGAAIFIVASYTANLAAFLATSYSSDPLHSIHDGRLHGLKVGTINYSSTDALLRRTAPRLHSQLQFILDEKTAVEKLNNGQLDVFVFDSPVLEYIRLVNNSRCALKIQGKKIGDDSYGIGLPKRSWLRAPLSKKILAYHNNGFIENLNSYYYREGSICKKNQSTEMIGISHHIGLFIMMGIAVATALCILLCEHCIFRWLVPWLWRKSSTSKWKSRHMMFISQRLHRIITSTTIVSPHYLLHEMLHICRSGDFASMFQKSTRQKKRINNTGLAPQSTSFKKLADNIKWLFREDSLDGFRHQNTQTDAGQSQYIQSKGSSIEGRVNFAFKSEDDEVQFCNDGDHNLNNYHDNTQTYGSIRPLVPELFPSNTPVKNNYSYSLSPRGQKSYMTTSFTNFSRKTSNQQYRQINGSSAARSLKNNNVVSSLRTSTSSYNDMESDEDVLDINDISKEELLVMWKQSEIDLHRRLRKVIQEKSTLEKQFCIEDKTETVPEDSDDNVIWI